MSEITLVRSYELSIPLTPRDAPVSKLTHCPIYYTSNRMRDHKERKKGDLYRPISLIGRDEQTGDSVFDQSDLQRLMTLNVLSSSTFLLSYHQQKLFFRRFRQFLAESTPHIFSWVT